MAARRVQAMVTFNHFNSTGKSNNYYYYAKVNYIIKTILFFYAVVEINVKERGKFFDALSALSL